MTGVNWSVVELLSGVSRKLSVPLPVLVSRKVSMASVLSGCTVTLLLSCQVRVKSRISSTVKVAILLT